MSRQEPDRYEQLEKSRQRQASAMKRFALAQTRIAQAEEHVQSLQAQRRGSLAQPLDQPAHLRSAVRGEA